MQSLHYYLHVYLIVALFIEREIVPVKMECAFDQRFAWVNTKQPILIVYSERNVIIVKVIFAFDNGINGNGTVIPYGVD